MKRFLIVFNAIVLMGFVSACGIQRPAIELGKKCYDNGDQVVYSYVWVHEKGVPLKATKEDCKKIKKN